MRFYECYVDNVDKLLTYSSSGIDIGRWVEVPFRSGLKKALVVREVTQPTFNTLKISQVLDIPKSNLIYLILWMMEYYFLGVREAFSLLHPKSAIKERKYFRLIKLDSESKIHFKKEIISADSLIKKIGLLEIKRLIKLGDISEEYRYNLRETSIASVINKEEMLLTKEQQNIYNQINCTDNNFFLIRAVTGSGKTAIYTKLIQQAVDRGEGVILLLPEISLAAEIFKRISVHIGNIAMLHSGLSQKELGENWLGIATGEKKIVIGVRSAIFAPVQNLKYIIIDEEHEERYKQDSSPMYDARAVAFKRAKLESLKLVMGSATPSIERYYYALQHKIVLSELDVRYDNYKMPNISVLNMQGTKDIIHPKLLAALKETVEKKEQALVIINRKAYSSSIQCLACGEVEKCVNCSLSLIYSKKDNLLRCNYCTFSKKYDSLCSCGLFCKNNIGKGSELIEEELKKHFTRIVRFDGDVNRESGSEDIFEKFRNSEYDILVGTKLISKGLDFKNVTLAAVIDGDSMLHFPDFRAAERTFQFLTQSAGRAGRSHKESSVWIQTYTPEHYAVSIKDYISFYTEEIKYREELKYPPFSRTFNITIKDRDSIKAEKRAQEIYQMLKGISAYPPIEAPIYKINNIYRYHIFIKENNRDLINTVLSKVKLLKDVSIDVDPINVM